MLVVYGASVRVTRGGSGTSSPTVSCALFDGTSSVTEVENVTVGGGGATVSFPAPVAWAASTAGTRAITVRCWKAGGSSGYSLSAGTRSIVGIVAKL